MRRPSTEASCALAPSADSLTAMEGQTITAVIGAGIAAVGLVYAQVQIELGRRQRRADRSYHYFNRYTDWDFVGRIRAARKVWTTARVGGAEPVGRDAWHAWWKDTVANHPDDANAIILVLNFWDELGLLLLSGRLDPDLAERLFSSPSKFYFEEIQDLVEALRLERRDGSVGRYWEQMNHLFRGGPWAAGRYAQEGKRLSCRRPDTASTGLETGLEWQWARTPKRSDPASAWTLIPGGRSREYVPQPHDADGYLSCRLRLRRIGGNDLGDEGWSPLIFILPAS